jgi:hypothetical protein
MVSDGQWHLKYIMSAVLHIIMCKKLKRTQVINGDTSRYIPRHGYALGRLAGPPTSLDRHVPPTAALIVCNLSLPLRWRKAQALASLNHQCYQPR